MPFQPGLGSAGRVRCRARSNEGGGTRGADDEPACLGRKETRVVRDRNILLAMQLVLAEFLGDGQNY